MIRIIKRYCYWVYIYIYIYIYINEFETEIMIDVFSVSSQSPPFEHIKKSQERKRKQRAVCCTDAAMILNQKKHTTNLAST
jgi:hypothetical protein